MDKQLYLRIAGKGLTANPLVKALLFVADRLNLKGAYSYLFYHHTEQGQKWRRFQHDSQETVNKIEGLIRSRPELIDLASRTRRVCEGRPESRHWWTLFDLLTPGEICQLYRDFLLGCSDDELLDFVRTTTRMTDNVLGLASLTSHGVAVDKKYQDSLRRVAIQQLAGVLVGFKRTTESEEAIKQRLFPRDFSAA